MMMFILLIVLMVRYVKVPNMDRIRFKDKMHFISKN
jgi:hypothetical protein